MRQQRPDLLFLTAIILILLSSAGVTWLSYQFIHHPAGVDAFAPVWSASRYMIEVGKNPYSQDAASLVGILTIQPLRSERFVYPYYSQLVFAPFSLFVTYDLARAVWMTFLLACSVGLVFASLMMTRWQPSILMLLFFFLFALGNYHAVRAVYLGNPAVLAALLIALGLLFVVQESDAAAGIFLGLASIKPQMAVLILPFVFLWAVSKRRMGLVASLLLTLVALIGVSLVIYPGWLVENYFQLLLFFEETFPASASAILWSIWPSTGWQVMAAVAGVLAIWLLVEWWRALGKDARWFLWTAALTLSVTNLIGFYNSVSDMVILVIPFALVFSVWTQRWRRAGSTLSVVVMLLVFGLLWGVFFASGMSWARPSVLFHFLMPLIAILLLYWVRYWALDSVRLRVQHLEALRKL